AEGLERESLPLLSAEVGAIEDKGDLAEDLLPPGAQAFEDRPIDEGEVERMEEDVGAIVERVADVEERIERGFRWGRGEGIEIDLMAEKELGLESAPRSSLERSAAILLEPER